MGREEEERPKKRWMDQVRQDCEDMGLCSIQDATWAAQDRECWRLLVDELPIRTCSVSWFLKVQFFNFHLLTP